FPTLVAELADGRRTLIDVQPLGHIGFHVNRLKARAAREWAHENGWGWLLWTGSAVGEPELAAHPVPAAVRDRLTGLLADGPGRRDALRQLRADGLEPLDLLALTVRHEWRWERAPFRLSAANQPRPEVPAPVKV